MLLSHFVIFFFFLDGKANWFSLSLFFHYFVLHWCPGRWIEYSLCVCVCAVPFEEDQKEKKTKKKSQKEKRRKLLGSTRVIRFNESIINVCVCVCSPVWKYTHANIQNYSFWFLEFIWFRFFFVILFSY